MKFVVTKGYSNEVDVRLHWETKEKLKSAFWTGAWFALGLASVDYIIRDNKKKSQKD